MLGFFFQPRKDNIIMGNVRSYQFIKDVHIFSDIVFLSAASQGMKCHDKEFEQAYSQYREIQIILVQNSLEKKSMHRGDLNYHSENGKPK